jgi:hypothetical protein
MKAAIHLLGPDYLPSPTGEPAYWCPVCKRPHRVAVSKSFSNGAKWSWNHRLDKPTFSPSVHTYYDRGKTIWRLKRDGQFFKVDGKLFEGPNEDVAKDWARQLTEKNDLGWIPVRREVLKTRVTVCHVHIRDGKIHILSDSQKLGGQVLPLELWEPREPEPQT